MYLFKLKVLKIFIL